MGICPEPQSDKSTCSAERKRLGSFYTPPELADWVATEVLEKAADAYWQIRHVIDPACGNGVLLEAMRRKVGEEIKLTGIDISPEAVAECKAYLGHDADILVGDALDPVFKWSSIRPDAVIINPPWGGALTQNRDFYQNNGYLLACGQFDISDLFVELALKIARPNAVLGFILPDAVFQPDHQTLRKMLLEHTLLLIARLGEGIFEDVCRSTVVIVLRKSPPPENHLIECLQVPASKRKQLRQRKVSFSHVKKLYSHLIPQSRFAKNPNSVFNISQSEKDYDVFQKFSRLPAFDWEGRVYLGRGVEIGKRGITVCCQNCGKHRVAPSTNSPTKCLKCGASIPASASRNTIIANSPNGSEWLPLIVGEDVDRYTAICRRFIRWGVPGIRYKPKEHFATKKLLIRKTGVGLRAAVDESGSATIQTVFYVVASTRKQEWILDYLQGVINSRPMLAWYLRWTGENQWRSHPYVTPKVLKRLPIPDPLSVNLTKIARRIAAESRKARKGINGSEYVVDNLVCRLYDLNSVDRLWVSHVLAETEDRLDYFNQMRARIVNDAFSEAPLSAQFDEN